MPEAREAKVEFDEESGQLVAAEAICADVDGKIVPCDSPEATVQVAGAGAPIPPKTAKKYGLKGGKGEAPGEPEPVGHPRSRPLDVSGKSPEVTAENDPSMIELGAVLRETSEPEIAEALIAGMAPGATPEQREAAERIVNGWRDE